MNLQLSLKKQWFEMTRDGIKTEDYREINEYWFKRIFNDVDKIEMPEIIERLKEGWSIWKVGDYYLHFPKYFEVNTLTLGYPSKSDTSRIIQFEHLGIEISTGREEWGAEPGKLYFVIKHGKRL